MKNKKFFKIILLFVAPFLLNGCAATATAQVRRDIKMDAWLGHDENELVEELGEPTSIMADITGDKILIYEFLSTKLSREQKITKKQSAISGYKEAEDKDSYGKKVEPVMVCKFWVDKDGIIQRWHRSGSGEKNVDVGAGVAYSNRNYYMRGNAIVGVKGRSKF